MGVFSMETLTKISRGEQLLVAYKQGTGWENHFLIQYGFVPQLEQYRTNDPKGAHTLQANQLRIEGKWDAAIDLIQSAIGFAKKDQWIDKEGIAKMHIFLGSMLITAGAQRRDRRPTKGQVASDYDTAEQILNEVCAVAILAVIREMNEITY
jgi:hypothetical protein